MKIVESCNDDGEGTHTRPVRRGGSLGANEPPFEMSFEKKKKATTVNELSFYNR